MTVDPEKVRTAIRQRRASAKAAAGFPYLRPSDAPWVRAKAAVERGNALTSDYLAADWSPAAVLALCDGALKLLDWHGGTHVCEDQLVHRLDTPKWSEDQADREPCDVVKVLAAMFGVSQEGTP